MLASDHEALPVSVLEAMRAGLPVVASDLPGIREQFDDTSAAVFVPENREIAIADALEALARDPARRVGMGQAARARWEQAFQIAPMANATWHVYQQALGHPVTAAIPMERA